MKTRKTYILLAAFACFTLSGCLTEPRSCTLDANSKDPGIAACAGDENASCVVKSHPACDGNVCIQWRGEPGFCSEQCQSNADCGEFEDCVEVVLASSEKHCVRSGTLD